ncbi:hypothetical protein [Mangrovibacterium marinum]|uniref:hypothetical protein n=1 Tax=Mangrovibacterium marinum TaxID=1639118 RepID=UPI0011B1D8C4|nr:hypothetical protein [Mangrovibacterium marinum]
MPLKVALILHLITIRLYAEGVKTCTPASVGVFFFKPLIAVGLLELIIIDRRQLAAGLAKRFFNL